MGAHEVHRNMLPPCPQEQQDVCRSPPQQTFGLFLYLEAVLDADGEERVPERVVSPCTPIPLAADQMVPEGIN
jgi:hypothetical protein